MGSRRRTWKAHCTVRQFTFILKLEAVRNARQSLAEQRMGVFFSCPGASGEKDYSELCNFLNVQAYPHLSKIKSTMGLALNELVSITYLSKWDVQKMSSKAGYKIVMMPGDELLAILNNTRSERREQLGAVPGRTLGKHEAPSLKPEDQGAVDLLKAQGVLPAKVAKLVIMYGAEVVSETVEYLAAQVAPGRRRIDNPAGLIIYSLENALPVPVSFMSSRKRRAAEEVNTRMRLV